MRSEIECLRAALRKLNGMVRKAEDNVAVMRRSGRANDARYESFRLQGLQDAIGCFPGDYGFPGDYEKLPVAAQGDAQTDICNQGDGTNK